MESSITKKIDIYWFSGTGNTLWVSKRFAGEMREYDFEVNLIPLPCPPPQNIPSGKMLAIAFPVYSQTMPGFVHEWPYRPIMLNIFQYLCEKVFIPVAGWLGKGFYADNEKCSRCGLCAKLCPLNNIHMEEGKLPQWDKKCQQCLRCVNFCPHKAIRNKRISCLYSSSYTCREITSASLFNDLQIKPL